MFLATFCKEFRARELSHVETSVNSPSVSGVAVCWQAWLNEKFSPELLDNKSEVVECVMEQLTHMVTSPGNTFPPRDPARTVHPWKCRLTNTYDFVFPNVWLRFTVDRNARVITRFVTEKVFQSKHFCTPAVASHWNWSVLAQYTIYEYMKMIINGIFNYCLFEGTSPSYSEF